MRKTDSQKKEAKFAALRKKAQRFAQKNLLPPAHTTPVSMEEARRLIAELQIHQIELELQNQELQKTQERLAAEREKYADLYNFAPAAYFTLDEDDLIVELNLMAAEMLGGERRRLLHHPLSSYLPPDSLQTLIANRAKALETGAPQRFELTLRPRKGKRLIYAQAQVSAIKEPTRPNEKLWRMALIDVTERKRAETEIRTLSRVVEQSQISVIITDPEGNIQYVNPKFCEVTGYSAEEVQGKNPRFLKAEGKSPAEYAELWKTIKAGGEWRGEFHNKTKNGEPFWESTIISPIKNEDGEITHFVAVKENVTERKRMEEELRESEARYRRLVETAPAVLYTFSDKRGGVYYSPLVETLLGYSREHLYAHPFLWAESIHPDDVPAVQAAVEQSKSGKPFSVEYRVRNANGEWRWLLDRSLGQRMEGGELLIEGLAVDVTELKLTQQALRESEQRYKSLFENNHAVMLLINPETRQIVDANPAACSYYGYSREQIATLKITDVNTLTPEQVSAEMQRARTYKRNHFFFRHRLASGEIRNVEVYSGPIQVGGQSLLYSIVHDVTERKKAERELKESHARLKATLDAMPDLLFETDREGRILDYHAAKPESLYLPPEKFLGKTPEEILPSEAAQTIQDALKRAEREGFVFGVVYSLPIGNQSAWYEISIAKKENSEEAGARFIALARDVTERKRFQDALRQVNENLLAHVREIEALQEQLREQAVRDVITGLFNRRYLQRNARPRDSARQAGREARGDYHHGH